MAPLFTFLMKSQKNTGKGMRLYKKHLKLTIVVKSQILSRFPDVKSTLKQLKRSGFKLFLVTLGMHQRQEKKIKLLGINDLFDEIIISDQEVGLLLEECYEMLLSMYNLQINEVAVVGDRVKEELRIGNTMGMTTIRMLHGRFKLSPINSRLQNVDYKIKRIFQIPTIISLINKGMTPDVIKIVAIGGGTGLPIALDGIKSYSNNITGIVAVTDSGRSSGVLRAEFGILPPGDARNCLVALSKSEEQEQDLNNLFQYRFNKGRLDGMSLETY